MNVYKHCSCKLTELAAWLYKTLIPPCQTRLQSAVQWEKQEAHWASSKCYKVHAMSILTTVHPHLPGHHAILTVWPASSS